MTVTNLDHEDDSVSRRQCLKTVDERLGIGRRAYSGIWWALAIWNAAAVFNVFSRTQQWGFALPLAPDFATASTPYGVAAVGGFGGAVLLIALLLALRFYALQWGRCFSSWIGKLPAIVFADQREGRLVPIAYAISLFAVIAFPLAAQIHFVDKFLAGTSSTTVGGVLHASGWRGHLLQILSPSAACRDFIYDGRSGFAFCEFYEPWALCVFAFLSFVVAGWALRPIFFYTR